MQSRKKSKVKAHLIKLTHHMLHWRTGVKGKLGNGTVRWAGAANAQVQWIQNLEKFSSDLKYAYRHF